MTARPCWNCRQPATHTLAREGSNTLHACDNCTRIDRVEAEGRGWTVARIGHVADARDTRPAFGITYRQYSDVRSSHVRIQADDVEQAMRALTEYIGNTQYAVTSIRPE